MAAILATHPGDTRRVPFALTGAVLLARRWFAVSAKRTPCSKGCWTARLQCLTVLGNAGFGRCVPFALTGAGLLGRWALAVSAKRTPGTKGCWAARLQCLAMLVRGVWARCAFRAHGRRASGEAAVCGEREGDMGGSKAGRVAGRRVLRE